MAGATSGILNRMDIPSSCAMSSPWAALPASCPPLPAGNGFSVAMSLALPKRNESWSTPKPPPCCYSRTLSPGQSITTMAVPAGTRSCSGGFGPRTEPFTHVEVSGRLGCPRLDATRTPPWRCHASSLARWRCVVGEPVSHPVGRMGAAATPRRCTCASSRSLSAAVAVAAAGVTGG